MSMIKLVNNNCSKSPKLLNESDVNAYLAELENWEIDNIKNIIFHEFKFKNYYNTIAFVNAIAWIVHQEDHHPDIKISYNKCHVAFSTHSVQGLSINDFICAAKINRLMFS